MGANLPGTYPTASATAPQPTAPSGPAAHAPGDGNRVARRALLTTAAVGACAVATPFVVGKGVELSEAEIKALLQREIGTLEDIALDEAVQIAELTRKIVQYLVLPVAQFFTTISGDALGVLIGSLQKTEAVLGFVHVPIQPISGLIGILQGWQTNEQLFPAALKAMTNKDLGNAEAYLKKLKSKVS
jgi:hypothetical protein